jgi:hypothetical protein
LEETTFKNGFFSLIKAYFRNGLLNVKYDQIFLLAKHPKAYSDDSDEDKPFNSRDFFKWFKKLDLSKYQYRVIAVTAS